MVLVEKPLFAIIRQPLFKEHPVSYSVSGLSKQTKLALADLQKEFDRDVAAQKEELLRRQEEARSLAAELKVMKKNGSSSRALSLVEKEIKSLREFKPGKVTPVVSRLDTDHHLNQISQSLVRIKNTLLKQLRPQINEEDAFVLQEMASVLEKGEKEIDRKVNALAVKNPAKNASERDILSRVQNFESHVLYLDLVKKAEEKLQSLLTTKKTPVASSPDYPYQKKRATLSNQCAVSAKKMIQNEHGYAEEGSVSMFSVFVSDARDHYKVGLALLEGDPRKIDNATSLDTASREELSDDVWSFVMNHLDYEKIKPTASTKAKPKR